MTPGPELLTYLTFLFNPARGPTTSRSCRADSCPSTSPPQTPYSVSETWIYASISPFSSTLCLPFSCFTSVVLSTPHCS
jgi:hypothetical protein